MQEPELSVIIPVMNIENRICDVLNTLKEDTKDISVEFLIIDRGSKDKTMQMALRFLRQNQLNGYVMQESGGNVSQVLNAGIQYANGTYITFVFPQRIYQSYLEEFLKKAKETNAESWYPIGFCKIIKSGLTKTVHTVMVKILCTNVSLQPIIWHK